MAKEPGLSVKKEPSEGPEASDRIVDRSGITVSSTSASISVSISESNTHSTPDKHESSVARAASTLDAKMSDAVQRESGIDVPAPYGTRSRNRAGIARPNYAEDREMDLDSEATSATLDETARSSVPGLELGQIEHHSSVSLNGGRKGLAAVSDDAASRHATLKDQIPGTSSFSVNQSIDSQIQPSKRRKTTVTTASMAQTQQNSGTGPSNVNGQARARRGSIATQVMMGVRETCMLSFEHSRGYLKDGRLVADDGTVLSANDHVYLVCEPPGEPYYLGRIMEFLHVDNDSSKAVDALRMNWYYRPKDIGRKTNDTRQVFASMHSDISPLTALRGTCQINHKTDIPDMDEYRRTQNCFWYEKLYDRYIHRYYEVIPTRQIVNVPAKVKRVLDDRWTFILVESGRGKELTSAVKSCKRCNGYCAREDSVDCAVCHQTYHMNCVRPPLLKKPSRGFAWACGPCSRAQERKLEARNTPNLPAHTLDVDDEDVMDEEDEEVRVGTGSGGTEVTSPSRSMDEAVDCSPGTNEQVHQASLWPFRYLGVHCKVEDALDYDDRIYPRASSRLGPRHQADVLPWPGRPFQLVKASEVRRKYGRGYHKKDPRNSKDAVAMESDRASREKREKWVIDEPTGYVPRGEDLDNDDPNNTAKLLFKPLEQDQEISKHDRAVAGSPNSGPLMCDQVIDRFLTLATTEASRLGTQVYYANFLDRALEILYENKFDGKTSIEALASVERPELKEPDLTAAEMKKFEDGVGKFGSELHSVKKHVKSVSAANIVRYYYSWKKTDRGKQIWGNYTGRKGKKDAKKTELDINAIKLQDDVADDCDDSAFDNDKAIEKKRGFQCKFCSTRSSRQWRRAPNTSAGATTPADPNNKSTVIWRKYAVQWDEAEENKRSAISLGKGTKRKADDPSREFQLNELNYAAHNAEVVITPRSGTPVPQTPHVALSTTQELNRKKGKGSGEKELPDPTPLDTADVMLITQPKNKLPDKHVAPLLEPQMPRPRQLPCAVCHQFEPHAEQCLSCRECRLTVHRNCYGIMGDVREGRWTCDVCSNDRSPQISSRYRCVLCPIEHTEHDFVEPAKTSHKKKTEKERERDRMERETAIKVAEFYQKRQETLNRPQHPREPLKRTAGDNWVHVTCAVWNPEVRFGDAKALQPSEGIAAIPLTRREEMCKICNTSDGACVACLQCRAAVHVECGHQNGYVLGFDINPVKGSRRDQVNTVSIGEEAGSMTAVLWCKEHVPSKTIVHRMHDLIGNTCINALQLFVQHYKQADLTMTGTVRKATLANQVAKAGGFSNGHAPYAAHHRRTSTASAAIASRVPATHGRGQDASHSILPESTTATSTYTEVRSCVTCGIKTSIKWYHYNDNADRPTELPDSGQKVRANDARQGQDSTNVYPSAPKHHVEMAVAALQEKVTIDEKTADCSQCHKCHVRMIRNPPDLARAAELKTKAFPPPAPFQPLQPLQLPQHPQHLPHPPQAQQQLQQPQAPPPHPSQPSHPSQPLRSSQLSQRPPQPPQLPQPPQPQQSQVSQPTLPIAPAVSTYVSPVVQPTRTLPSSSPVPVHGAPRYNSWQHSVTYSPPHNIGNGIQHSPNVSGGVISTTRYNGHQSPHTTGTPATQLRTQSQPVQHGMVQTPPTHTNGSPNLAMNGSVHPHYNMNGMPPMASSATYMSSISPRLSATYLTNGGAPLRTPEHTFTPTNHGPILNHSQYSAPPHQSPHYPREPLGVQREPYHPTPRPAAGGVSRTTDNRVNGGASASPSLQNLLS